MALGIDPTSCWKFYLNDLVDSIEVDEQASPIVKLNNVCHHASTLFQFITDNFCVFDVINNQRCWENLIRWLLPNCIGSNKSFKTHFWVFVKVFYILKIKCYSFTSIHFYVLYQLNNFSTYVQIIHQMYTLQICDIWWPFCQNIKYVTLGSNSANRTHLPQVSNS